MFTGPYGGRENGAWQSLGGIAALDDFACLPMESTAAWS